MKNLHKWVFEFGFVVVLCVELYKFIRHILGW